MTSKVLLEDELSRSYVRAAGQLVNPMLLAVRKYQEAKAYFAEITEAYRSADIPVNRIIDHEGQMAADARRIKAGKDAEFFREEASMYASVIGALMSVANWGPDE